MAKRIAHWIDQVVDEMHRVPSLRTQNPKRIPEIVAALTACWYANPDLRIGQLVCNISCVAGHRDPFNIEDHDFLAQMRRDLEGMT